MRFDFNDLGNDTYEYIIYDKKNNQIASGKAKGKAFVRKMLADDLRELKQAKIHIHG